MYLLTDSDRARFLKDWSALIHAQIKILSHFLYFPSYAYKIHIYRLPCINRREIKLISKQIYSIWWYIHTCYSTLQAPSQTTRWKDFRTIWLRINTFCNRIFSFFKYGYLARPAYFSVFLFVLFFQFTWGSSYPAPNKIGRFSRRSCARHHRGHKSFRYPAAYRQRGKVRSP